MKIAPVAQVKARLSSYLKRLEDGPVVITKNGKPVAALIATGDDEAELERLLLAYTPKFRRLMEQAKTNLRKSGGVEHKAFWQKVESDQSMS